MMAFASVLATVVKSARLGAKSVVGVIARDPVLLVLLLTFVALVVYALVRRRGKEWYNDDDEDYEDSSSKGKCSDKKKAQLLKKVEDMCKKGAFYKEVQGKYPEIKSCYNDDTAFFKACETGRKAQGDKANTDELADTIKACKHGGCSNKLLQVQKPCRSATGNKCCTDIDGTKGCVDASKTQAKADAVAALNTDLRVDDKAFSGAKSCRYYKKKSLDVGGKSKGCLNFYDTNSSQWASSSSSAVKKYAEYECANTTQCRTALQDYVKLLGKSDTAGAISESSKGFEYGDAEYSNLPDGSGNQAVTFPEISGCKYYTRTRFKNDGKWKCYPNSAKSKVTVFDSENQSVAKEFGDAGLFKAQCTSSEKCVNAAWDRIKAKRKEKASGGGGGGDLPQPQCAEGTEVHDGGDCWKHNGSDNWEEWDRCASGSYVGTHKCK